jgi:hypothetical protein
MALLDLTMDDKNRPTRVTARVSNDETAFTVIALRVNPNEAPALNAVGFQTTTVVYVVFAGPALMFVDYDNYRLVRQIPGDVDWMLVDLADMAEKLLE